MDEFLLLEPVSVTTTSLKYFFFLLEIFYSRHYFWFIEFIKFLNAVCNEFVHTFQTLNKQLEKNTDVCQSRDKEFFKI